MTEEVYKKLYLHMMHECECALQILIRAQQDCEQWLLDAEDKGETDETPEQAP